MSTFYHCAGIFVDIQVDLYSPAADAWPFYYFFEKFRRDAVEFMLKVWFLSTLIFE